MISKSPRRRKLSVFQCVNKPTKSFHFVSESLHYERELLLNQMAQINSVRQMKRKWKMPASASVPSLSSQLGCCWVFGLVSTRTQQRERPCAHTELPGPQGSRKKRNLDLTFCCPVKAFRLFLLRCFATHLTFACVTFKITTKEASESGNKAAKGTGKKKSKYLTRSQSTFLKKGWPMMSAKPVWGWQPRRSLGSWGSKGQRRWETMGDDRAEDENMASGREERWESRESERQLKKSEKLEMGLRRWETANETYMWEGMAPLSATGRKCCFWSWTALFLPCWGIPWGRWQLWPTTSGGFGSVFPI